MHQAVNFSGDALGGEVILGDEVIDQKPSPVAASRWPARSPKCRAWRLKKQTPSGGSGSVSRFKLTHYPSGDHVAIVWGRS